MTTSHIEISPDSKKAARRFGYVISIAINLAMLVIVQNILEWGWLPFLTNEFAEVVPWISFSLIASIVANLIYQIDDSQTVKSVGQIGVNLISVWVTYSPHSLPVRLLRLPIRLRDRDEGRPHPCDCRRWYRSPGRGHQSRIHIVRPQTGRPVIANPP